MLENDEDGYFEKAFKEVPDLAKSEGNLTSRAFYQALRMEKRDLAMDEKAASYFSLDSLKDIAENEQKNVMLLFMEKLKSSTSGKEKGDKEGKNTSEVKIKKEKKIYWEKILRNVVGGVPYGKRHTHMRLNRRQPLRSDLSGTLSDRKASLVCAIDTSYSMDKEQVSKALSQILKLKMSLGFDMTLIQCDSKIQEVRKIKTKNDIPDIVKGRGGTAFTPVIEYLNDHKEYRNSVLIYFTEEAKDEVFRKYYHSLAKGGMLFIGSTEQIMNYRDIGFERKSSFYYVKPFLIVSKHVNLFAAVFGLVVIPLSIFLCFKVVSLCYSTHHSRGNPQFFCYVSSRI